MLAKTLFELEEMIRHSTDPKVTAVCARAIMLLKAYETVLYSNPSKN